MLQSARTAGVALRDEIRKSEAGSIPLMQQFGLNVVHGDAQAVAEWRQLAEGIWPKLRGPVVPVDLFDEVKRLRDDYRKTHHEAAVAASR
jgi:cation transport ATPase